MYKNRTINSNDSILNALKKMDALDKKLLIVLKEDGFAGLLSAGDIQRAIIQNKELNTPISQVLRKNIRTAKPEDSIDEIKQMMFEFRMELCPVVNDLNEILNVYFWESIFGDEFIEPQNKFDLPVVIMAGGLGTRLKPLTNVLPKALVPVGDDTIIEEILKRFYNQGSNKFYISVNHKSELIEYYLNSRDLPYSLEFFKEDKPMGTAGSLSLLKGKINDTFFVSNCDIVIDQDYSQILEYHRQNNNKITVVAALKHYHIPYGTIESADNGQLVDLIEKPDLTFKINSGMYVLEPEILQMLNGDFVHITAVIEQVLAKGEKVGVFPVSEKSWKDIGEWDEYLKNYVRK